MPLSLNGRVALVTGSSRGLGHGIALSLGKAGAKVVVNYLNVLMTPMTMIFNVCLVMHILNLLTI